MTPVVRKVILLSCWFSIQAGIFLLGFMKQKNDRSLDRLNKPVGFSIWISRGSALILHFDVMLILFPVCRGLWTIIRSFAPYSTFTRWLIDGQIDFHRHIGYSILFASIIHTLGHLHPAGLTGLALVLIQFFIFTAAIGRAVKKAKYEIFVVTHILAIPWLLVTSIHGIGCFVRTSDGICKGYETWKYILPGLIVYIFDLSLRYLRRSKPGIVHEVIKHQGNVVEIRFTRSSLFARPGQWVLLKIPSISNFEYHPFTLTGCLEDGYFSVHIRVVGNWTHKLMSSDYHCILHGGIYVDGPYGAAAQHYDEYPEIILIGAGIGVTPFVSIMKSLLFRWSKSSALTMPSKVYFIWICREKESFSWFQEILDDLEKSFPFGYLKILIYLTGSLKMPDIYLAHLNYGSKYDIFTQLEQKTHFGRPNIPVLLGGIKKTVTYSIDIHRIGVFLCGGPYSLEMSTRNACNELSKNSRIKFEFHRETFQ